WHPAVDLKMRDRHPRGCRSFSCFPATETVSLTFVPISAAKPATTKKENTWRNLPWTFLERCRRLRGNGGSTIASMEPGPNQIAFLSAGPSRTYFQEIDCT